MRSEEEMRRDKILLFVWPIAASLLSFLFHTNFLISVLLFFGVPSIYVSCRNKGLIKNQLFFSLSAFIIVTAIDYICQITGAWSIPHSAFPYRILGVVPIDQFIWLFLYTYLIVAYHNYFLEHKYKDKAYYPKLKYLYLLFSSVLFLFFTVFFLNQKLLHIRYFYLVFGTVLLFIPVAFVVMKLPSIFNKFVKTGVYFFFLTIIYELTALSLGHWTFPGKDFIGYVTLFGQTFPFEEFFFWMVLGAIAILSYYEFFDEKEGEKITI